MNANERLDMLQRRYTDKSLSRTERREVLEEITRIRYRDDPRKPLSVRKQTIMSAVQSLILAVNFAYMGFSDNLGDSLISYGTRKVLSLAVIVLFAALLVGALIVQSKYKNEPNDELSLKNKVRADSMGFVVTSLALLAVTYAYFLLTDSAEFVIKVNAFVFFICAFISLTNFVNRVIFLVLEGGDADTGEEEEEE